MDTPAPGKLTYTDWTLIELEFDPQQLHTRETVFTIGNGYLGTRGSFEEGYPHATPATLIHGVYDDVPVVYTELANCPDWLSLAIIVNGERFRLDRGEIIHYERQLDLHSGILSRSVRWRSPIGQTLDLRFDRFASLADEHLLGLRCQLTPVDFAGTIELQSSINGYPENQGFNHWERLDQGKTEPGIWLQVRTRSSRIELGMATDISLIGTDPHIQVANTPGFPTLTATYSATAGQTVTLEKVVTVFTSQEDAQPVLAAQMKLATLPTYTALLDAHQLALDAIWQHSDIQIEGDLTAQLAVRYNLFQLLIAASPHNDRISIPAKTLSGFGYRGHVFWDTEIFILPFFIFTQPNLARNLLSYRYHTLNGARRKASHSGYQGAMFAWESAMTGDEVTPRWSLPNDPYAADVRIWVRDREIHISADIAYTIWRYWQATGDDAWMRDYGAEIILDTAIFWGSRVEWAANENRYELNNTIGPDEYHEQVDNNAFTNRMVQWHLQKALLIYTWLSKNFPDRAAELTETLKLTPETRSHWQTVIHSIYTPDDTVNGSLEQFDGFFQLEDIDLEDYEPRDRSIQTVLGIEATNKRQVLKQPDVLMLLYLLRSTQEFPYNYAVLKKNWDYYAPRTDITYGSSLGPAIHAILAADVGQAAEGYQQFMQAAMVDLEDTRHNTPDGIHAASAGGVWQAVVFGFGGIQFTEQEPVATPQLPPTWTRLKFKLHWHGTWHDFDLTPPDLVPDIRGFIFDLDGVLTDTAELHYHAWQRLADELGLPFSREANEALRGVARRESLLKIVGNRQYSESQLQEMMERKNRYYVESIDTITPQAVLPGAIELLTEIRQAGLKIAIGSASKNARSVIEKLGLVNYVDAIADGNSVQQPKPAPDLFLYAAKLIGLEPAQCVVVEDAAVGVEAALAGGMWTVGLGPVERFTVCLVTLPWSGDPTGARRCGSNRFKTVNIVLPNLSGIHLSDLKFDC